MRNFKKYVAMLGLSSMLGVTLLSSEFELVEPLKVEADGRSLDKKNEEEIEIQLIKNNSSLKDVEVIISPVENGVADNSSCIELNYSFDKTDRFSAEYSDFQKVNLKSGRYKISFKTSLSDGVMETSRLDALCIKVKGEKGELVYSFDKLKSSDSHYYSWENTEYFYVNDGSVIESLPSNKTEIEMEEMKHDFRDYLIPVQLISNQSDAVSSISFVNLKYNTIESWYLKSGPEGNGELNRLCNGIYQIFLKTVDEEELKKIEGVKISGKNGTIVFTKDELINPIIGGEASYIMVEDGNVYGYGSSMRLLEKEEKEIKIKQREISWSR